jgi:hypothetical protein
LRLHFKRNLVPFPTGPMSWKFPLGALRKWRADRRELDGSFARPTQWSANALAKLAARS